MTVISSYFWPNVALSELWLSGIPTFNYNTDGEGRPSTMTATSGQAPVTAISFNTFSEPTSVTYGSGDSDSLQYDPNTGRMTQYQAKVNGVAMTGGLTWNPNGTLKQLAVVDALNTANTQTCLNTFDTLARLTQIDCGAGKWGQSFTYGAFGNISKSPLSGRVGTSFQPVYSNTTNRFTVSGYTVTYDNNGNLTQDPYHRYAWDAEGKLTSLDGGTTTFVYDALGRRVEQTKAGVSTGIVYSALGGKLALMSKYQTPLNWFVPLPGGGTAEYPGGAQLYRHPDWLGSARVVSNANQTLHYDGSYAPFGESYNETGTTDRSFTGQNEDAVTDLYDFMYREYHPTQGRWVSPDPAGLGAVDPANPQSWNRYAYVLNNPLAYKDPLGLDCVYLNDSGDGIEEIDRSGGASECWSDGGYWADGYVGNSSWVQTFSNSDQVVINSSVSGFLARTLAGSTNDGGIGFSQMFAINTSLADIFGSPYTPSNYSNPMATSARQMLRAVADAAPGVCGGGVYYYAGRELSAGPLHGFAGVINEFDSVSGASGGALFEAGGGEGLVGGGGLIRAADGHGVVGGHGLAFGGFGVDSPAASASVGAVGFSSGAGLYAEGFLFGRGGGFGAYLNVTTNAGCDQHK